jgi:hypothetical protein
MSDVTSDHWDQAFEEGKKAGINASINNLTQYIDEFHKHVGDLTCQPLAGDTCDMTAAVRVAVNRLKAML